MASTTITAADSSFIISSSDFALAATALADYAADAAFAFDEVVTSEMVQGVDGTTSVGWLPRMFPQTVTFRADAASRDIFDLIVAAQDAQRTVYRLQGVITLPGLGRTFVLNKGVLTSYAPLPNAAKMLQQTQYKITWESINVLPT